MGHAYLRPECSHVSEMERVKLEIFGGEMAKLEKVRYGSNGKRKPWKAHEYWGFEYH